jgi:hypothetical protein
VSNLDMTEGVYRRIYPSFIKNDKFRALSWAAEAWFWRLLVLADDHGNLDGDMEWLVSNAGRKRKVTPEQAQELTDELVAASLVRFYRVGSDQYINIPGFIDRQPANRNGRRIQRVPLPTKKGRVGSGESGGIRVNPGEPKHTGLHQAKPGLGNPGESGGIRNNPGESNPSDSDSDVDSDADAEAVRTPPVLEFANHNGRGRGITLDGWLAIWHGRGRASPEFVAAATAFYESREQCGKPITKAGAAALVTPCEGFTDAEVIADMQRCAAGGFVRLEPRKQAAPGPTPGAVVPKAQAALESYMRKVRDQ